MYHYRSSFTNVPFTDLLWDTFYHSRVFPTTARHLTPTHSVFYVLSAPALFPKYAFHLFHFRFVDWRHLGLHLAARGRPVQPCEEKARREGRPQIGQQEQGRLSGCEHTQPYERRATTLPAAVIQCVQWSCRMACFVIVTSLSRALYTLSRQSSVPPLAVHLGFRRMPLLCWLVFIRNYMELGACGNHLPALLDVCELQHMCLCMCMSWPARCPSI